MDIAKILTIIQEVNKTLELLTGLGLKINGSLDLQTLIGLIKR